MAGTVFPAFLKLEHQADGSAKSSFLAEVAAITTSAEKQFERSFGEITQIVNRSISGFKLSNFKLDVDVSSLRQAAADADFAAERLRTMRDAAAALAKSTGDTTAETRRYLQALTAQTNEAVAAKAAAEAQVTTYSRLQQEIDRTVNGNARLSQSYRETFLEQARSINAATEAQKRFNDMVGMGRPLKSAADSAKVFESMSYAPKADTRSGLDRVMDGGAGIDRAAVSAATLDQVLGRVAAKGPQVAAALQAAGQAAESSASVATAAMQRLAAEQEQTAARAAAAQAKLAQETGQLRAALDPAFAVQKRFDDEMERAERLYQAGAISVREYGAAQTMARTSLQDSYTAIMRNGMAQEQVAKRGTDAQRNVINSTRASRTAYMMLGQQMQDMSIQAQMGTNAFMIFGQQVPQAAFALSGLSESANKTQATIGRMATFMSGPWGAAIFVAIAALGPLVAKLFETTDETTKAERAARSFSEVLMDSTSSYKEVTAAAKAYADQQERSRTTTLEQIQLEATAIATRLKAAISIREQLGAEMERYNFGISHPGGVGGIIGTAGALAVSGIDQRKAENAKAIAELQRTSGEVVVKAADTIAKIQSDPAERIKAGFDTLRQSARNTIKDVGTLTARLADLNRQQAAAEKALKPSSGASDRQYGREIDMSSAKSIAAAAGFTVTSGQRSRAEQQWLYDHKRTAENPVALPGTSAHEKGNALDIAFGAGVSPASIKKAFAEEGVRLTKILKETGHFHIEWSTSGADKAQHESEALARAQQQLKELGDRSTESIQRINEQFNVQPKLVDRAAQATRKLADIVAEVSAAKPEGFQQMIADAEAAKGVVEDGLLRPFQELEKSSQRRIQLAETLAAGHEAEANALQSIWQLEDQIGTEDDLRASLAKAIAAGRVDEVNLLQSIIAKYPALIQGVRDQAENEYRINEALKARQVVTDAYLNATRSIRGELESLFAGDGADFGKIFKRLQAQLTVEKLFGNSLRKLEETIKTGGFQTSVDTLASTTDEGSKAVKTFADSVLEQAGRVSGAGGIGSSGSSGGLVAGDDSWARYLASFDSVFKRAAAANDNAAGGVDPDTGDIVVVAPKPDRNTVAGTTLTAYSEMFGSVLTKPLIDAIADISPALAGKLGPMLSGAVGGMATGGIPGAILGGLKELPGISKSLSKSLGKGLEGAQTGSMVAGLGKALGLKMSETGAQIGGAIGSFIPIPGGSLIGSVIGGLLGGLFHSVKSGYAQIRPSGDDVTVAGTYGRTGDLQDNARKAANALIDTMRSLAERVGGTLGGFDMDIGTKDDKFVVNLGDGRGGTNTFDSEEEAVRFAISGAIAKGAIKGVRDGTQRLLQGTGDIEQQLQKAMDFEGVFKKLKGYSDPVGAALDTLDAEFKRLQGIFKEAGASTAEYADLEKLYGLERTKAVKEAMSSMTASLQSLLDDLTIGDNGLSLGDRRANAMAKYAPLAAQVQAGDTSAFDDFSAAARSLIDISREMYGSQNAYFDLLNEVTGISQGALNATSSTANQSATRPDIFTGVTSSTDVVDNSSVVSAISGMNADLVSQLAAANANLGILIKQGLDSGNLASVAQATIPMWVQSQSYF